MSIARNRFRLLMTGFLVAAAMVIAPAAMARGHFSIGIALPGISLGVGPGYYGAYAAPAYYAPGYYAPAYYGRPYYPAAYYGGGYYGRSYRDYNRPRGYYNRGYGGRGYGGHRSYYGRGGAYRHR